MENLIDLTENDDDCVSVIFTTNNINNYDHLKQENLLFCELLEKCLNLENSTGMLAVINKKLVAYYNSLENSVKTSIKLEKALKETLIKLNNDPSHKFTHIQLLCDFLSDLKPEKKRVQLITLDKNVTANKFSMLSCKRPKTDQRNNVNICSKKPKTNEVEIKKSTSSLECDQSFSIEVIDILNETCEDRAMEHEIIHNCAITSETCSDSRNIHVPDESVDLSLLNSLNIEKNIDIGNNIEICSQSIDTVNCQENPLNNQANNNECQVLEPSQSIESITTNHLDTENVKEMVTDVTLNDKDKLDEHINLTNESRLENKVLPPLNSSEISSNNLNTKEKIKELENKIAKCKRKIAKLDEQEVCNDSKRSPYMRSEKLKAEIVMLYQELCQLTGEHPVRRRQVCIKAIEGHPSGPLKRLETFLNDNIGSDGHPPFPNFREVVKCVLVANKEDKLGWSTAKVMDEARALFSYCGRALQKRRQKREYEDLISKVDTCDEDPADHDAELRAKLEANKQIAIKRELEVLQKFSMMQKQSDKVSDEEDIFSDSETDESFPDANTTDNKELIENKDINMNEGTVPDTDSNDINIVKIKEEPEENITDNQSNFKYSAMDNENRIIIEISDSSDEEQSCRFSMMQNQSVKVGKILSDNNELIENKDMNE